MAKKLRILMVFLVMTCTISYGHLILNGTAAIEGQRENHRQGRYLVFPRGSNLRLFTGFLFPLFIPKWQNINCLNNWSIGIPLPPNAKAWYQKQINTVNWAQRPNRRGRLLKEGDNTRARFYKFMENHFEKVGSNGHECLLRMICQVAEAPIVHNGIIGELMHTVFTPNDDEMVDEDYKAARKAGTHGMNCDELYDSCPYGHSPLDKFSVLGMQTPAKIIDAFMG